MFDYGIYNGTAKRIVAIADRIRRSSEAIASEAIDIGEQLIEAKSLVGHGRWSDWLLAEFGWSERTARNYMAVAQRFGKSALNADLSLTVMVELAPESVPQAAVDEVVALAETGEEVTVKKAKAIKRKHIGDRKPINRIAQYLPESPAEEPAEEVPVEEPAPPPVIQPSRVERMLALAAEMTDDERREFEAAYRKAYGDSRPEQKSLIPDDPADLKPPKKIDTPEVVAAWRKWCDYNARKGHPLTIEEAEALLPELARSKPETVVRRINHSIASRMSTICLAKELPNDFEHPEESAVLGYAQAMKIDREVAKDFFLQYSRQGWRLGNGQVMADWQQSLHHWARSQQHRKKLLDPKAAVFDEPSTPDPRLTADRTLKPRIPLHG